MTFQHVPPRSRRGSAAALTPAGGARSAATERLILTTPSAALSLSSCGRKAPVRAQGAVPAKPVGIYQGQDWCLLPVIHQQLRWLLRRARRWDGQKMLLHRHTDRALAASVSPAAMPMCWGHPGSPDPLQGEKLPN